MSLGEYIKTVRHQRGLSQWELSRLSGLTRSHVSRLELDDIEDPSAETFLSLARALKVHPNDLYQAAGYIDEKTRFRRRLVRTPEEAFEDLEKVVLQPAPALKKINRKACGAAQHCQRGPHDGESQPVSWAPCPGFQPETRDKRKRYHFP